MPAKRHEFSMRTYIYNETNISNEYLPLPRFG